MYQMGQSQSMDYSQLVRILLNKRDMMSVLEVYF